MIPYSDERQVGIVIVTGLAVVLVSLILCLTYYGIANRELEAKLIQQAMEQKVDLSIVRCVLNPHITGCDTVSLVREVRVDTVPLVRELQQPHRFSLRDLPQPPGRRALNEATEEIQP